MPPQQAHTSRPAREILGGATVIFRGPESLQYPSRKEFQHLGEIMHQVRSVETEPQLASLTSAIGQLIPHQFSGCGVFNIPKRVLQMGHTTYNAELHELYMSQDSSQIPRFNCSNGLRSARCRARIALTSPSPRRSRISSSTLD